MDVAHYAGLHTSEPTAGGPAGEYVDAMLERVVTLSETMVEYATAGRWDAVTAHETERQRLVWELFETHPTLAESEGHREVWAQSNESRNAHSWMLCFRSRQQGVDETGRRAGHDEGLLEFG